MKKFVAILVSLMLILSATAALAEATVIKAGCNPEFPPFESMDDNNVIVGFDADLAAEISKDIGATIELESTSFDSIVTGIQTGLYELGISGFYITAERMANVDFSIPYLQATQSCIIKKDGGITDNASLAGKMIGSQSGTTGIDAAEASTDEANVFSYSKALDALMDLQGGKLDAVITDTPVAMNLLAQLNDDSLVISDTVSFKVEYYGIAITKGNTDMKAKFDASLARMQADGTIDTLIAKWDNCGESVADVDAAVAAIMAAAAQ